MASRAFKISMPRVLAVVMAVVVLSFLMAAALTRHRETKIEARLRDLVGNVLPSILYLSYARNHLQDVLEKADQLFEESPERRSILRQNIFSQVRDMEGSFRTYLALPFFPSELEIASGVEQREEAFSVSLKRFVQSLSTNNSALKAATLKDVRAQGLLLDRAFFRIVEFDTSQGQRLGLEVSSIRSESLFLSIWLNVFCVAIAAMATALAIRMRNNSVRSLEDRANELELFAGRVAHDLKNPLGVILMSNSLMDREDYDDQTRGLIHRISVTGKRMTLIIDGLLDFARSGAHPEPNGSADLGAIVDSTLLAVRADADNSNVQIQVEPFQGPLILACSDGVLGSILTNLLRNALKYIVDGSDPNWKIKIRVTHSANVVRVEIEDNGPGIDPGKLSSIFEPYFRASSKRPGIGLGLSTVKRLVESHGGKLGVTSTPGEGSCFWFELPKHRDQ